MHSRSTVIIGAGVVVAILGAVLVFAYARSLQGSAGAATSSGVGAFVAVGPIPSGTKGSAIATLVKATVVPSSARPADAVASLSALSSLQAISTIEAGQVITASQFGAPGTPSTNTGGLSIPAGLNAVTVNVPIPQDVAGYVSPGDLVNVYMASKDIGNVNSVRLLVSNATVLSTTAADTPPPAAGAPAVPATSPELFTLALSPQNSEKILFAETYESVWFALVHPGDPAATTTGETAPTLFK